MIHFTNIAAKYGYSVPATIEDYLELNPNGRFVIDGDELREYEPDGPNVISSYPLMDSEGKRYCVVGQVIGEESE